MLVFLSSMKWFIFVGLIGLILGDSHVGYVSKCFWTSDSVSTMFLLKVSSWIWALFWILVWWFSQGHYPWTARISNQSILKEISPERTDVEAEAPILWPPDGKNWLIGKEPDARKDWRLEEKGTKEDEMVEWHHQLNGHEFEQAPGVGDGQGWLACRSPWGQKESDITEQLNWTEPKLLEGQVSFTASQAFWIERALENWF